MQLEGLMLSPSVGDSNPGTLDYQAGDANQYATEENVVMYLNCSDIITILSYHVDSCQVHLQKILLRVVSPHARSRSNLFNSSSGPLYKDQSVRSSQWDWSKSSLFSTRVWGPPPLALIITLINNNPSSLAKQHLRFCRIMWQIRQSGTVCLRLTTLASSRSSLCFVRRCSFRTI